MQSLSVLVLLACCGALAASPARLRRGLTSLPAGIPLDVLFSACGDQTASTDIGPCVEKLLSSAIKLSKPLFTTGIEVGGKTVVLEPLSLKDIPEKANRKFRFSVRNLKVHGLSSLQVRDVTLQPDRLALELSFDQLRASTKMALRYSFIRADTDVDLTLTRPSIRIESGWTLAAEDGKLFLQLIDPEVDIKIESFSARITRLGGLGNLLQTILNNNNSVLLQFFVPELERQAKSKLEKEFKKIKLAG